MMHGESVRIVLLSSTVFGYQCLKEGILGLPEVRVVGILTTPQSVNISYSEKSVVISTHVTFDDLAVQAGCDVIEMRGKMTGANYLQCIERWSPDLFLVLGWYYMIPRIVRERMRLGCVGIHASLLPKYRGGAPIPWAIINGESETGVTFFYLEDGVDNGDFIAQERFSIDENDTCAIVYEKATSASIKILREYLPRIAIGTAPRMNQDETKATYFPQRKPEDGLIDWSWSAKRIRDFIRAQTKPYPGAFTYINNKKVIIWDANVIE
jgi:methionyl-tRNA formyltransferase